MNPVLLAALVGLVAFIAGLFAGGAVVYRLRRDLDDIFIPLRASSCASLALGVLRDLRNGKIDDVIQYLDHRVDLELKHFVLNLREHPRALENEQFRSLLGRIAEYRMAHPSPEPCPDLAPEFQMDDGKTVRVWPSLNEALTFARRHGIINLARP